MVVNLYIFSLFVDELFFLVYEIGGIGVDEVREGVVGVLRRGWFF